MEFHRISQKSKGSGLAGGLKNSPDLGNPRNPKKIQEISWKFMEILRIPFQNLGKSSQNSGRSCFDAAVSLGVSESLSLSLPSLKRARQKFLGVHRCLVQIKKFFSTSNLYDRYAPVTPLYFSRGARKPQTEAVFWKIG